MSTNACIFARCSICIGFCLLRRILVLHCCASSSASMPAKPLPRAAVTSTVSSWELLSLPIGAALLRSFYVPITPASFSNTPVCCFVCGQIVAGPHFSLTCARKCCLHLACHAGGICAEDLLTPWCSRCEETIVPLAAPAFGRSRSLPVLPVGIPDEDADHPDARVPRQQAAPSPSSTARATPSPSDASWTATQQNDWDEELSPSPLESPTSPADDDVRGGTGKHADAGVAARISAAQASSRTNMGCVNSCSNKSGCNDDHSCTHGERACESAGLARRLSRQTDAKNASSVFQQPRIQGKWFDVDSEEDCEQFASIWASALEKNTIAADTVSVAPSAVESHHERSKDAVLRANKEADNGDDNSVPLNAEAADLSIVLQRQPWLPSAMAGETIAAVENYNRKSEDAVLHANEEANHADETFASAMDKAADYSFALQRQPWVHQPCSAASSHDAGHLRPPFFNPGDSRFIREKKRRVFVCDNNCGATCRWMNSIIGYDGQFKDWPQISGMLNKSAGAEASSLQFERLYYSGCIDATWWCLRCWMGTDGSPSERDAWRISLRYFIMDHTTAFARTAGHKQFQREQKHNWPVDRSSMYIVTLKSMLFF